MSAPVKVSDPATISSHVWRGGGRAVQKVSPLPSGSAALDGLLGGGWPRGGLIEFLVDDTGQVELGLLLPALARITGGARAGGLDDPPPWIMLISPPWIPYAPGLQGRGVNVSRVLVSRAAQARDALWAMEETLQAGTCGAVIVWVERPGSSALRRLQLAAAHTRTLAIVVRAARHRHERSPAVLRLRVGWKGRQLRVETSRNRFRPVGTVCMEGPA